MALREYNPAPSWRNRLNRAYWYVRDKMIDGGIIEKPSFHLKRRRVGKTRARLVDRGTCRRLRHVSLKRLLEG